MIKIKLTKPVTIGEKEYEKDDLVEVSESTAEWLVAQEAAEKATESQVKRPTKPKAES